MTRDDESGAGQVRPKYLTRGAPVGASAAANDTAPAVTLTRQELRALVTEAVAEALEAERAPAPALLTRAQLASVLGCSQALVDKFIRQGIPCVRLGDSPRFAVPECLEWLRSGQKAGGQ